MSRRDVLKWGAFGATGLLGAPFLTACGASSSKTGDAAGPIPSSSASGKLAPFDSTVAAGPATGLPKRVAWANTTPIGIFAALGQGMSKAADDQGLQYLTANAEGDPQVNVDQINTFLARGIGGVTVQPLNIDAQAPVMRKAIEQGACVIGIITNPCTMQIAASQYEIGLQQGQAAAKYVKEKLGGKATVYNANLNKLAPELARRGQGVLDGLKEAGSGVTLIDEYVAPQEQTREKVFGIVSSKLQRYPDIKVILGVDGFVLPAYRAFEQTGRLKDDLYFSSIDGDPEALNLVAKGGPYRASLAFAWKLMGYGMGRFTADWVAGKSIPRVMVANATLVDSPESAKQFLSDAADPKSTFEDRSRYEKYLPLLGNVSYADRNTVWTTNYQL